MSGQPGTLNDLVNAIRMDDSARVDAILAEQPGLARASVGAEQGHDHSLLHRAIPGDGEPLPEARVATVRRLLDAGAEVDAVGWGANNGHCTPLTMAAWGGHAPIVRLLLERGAHPNASAEQVARGHRPIDTAADHGHTEAVEALLEAGATHTLAHLLKVGLTARVEEFLAKDPEAARRLLEDGTPPLHLAATLADSEALLELLLSHGAALDAVDACGRTAVHLAIEYGREPTARRLLELGAPRDLFALAGLAETTAVAEMLALDSALARTAQADGVTPLFFAAFAGDARTAELLLANGAAVSPRARRFWACLTPLHLALQRGHRAVTSLLLEHGPDLDACSEEPDRYWPSPLHAAARWGTPDEVIQLLDRGADPNGGGIAAGSAGAGGLAWAVRWGNEPMVRLFLKRGADPRHSNNRTVLHLAAERGHTAIVRLLLECDADPRAVDVDGQTARERAARFGKNHVATLLESWDR
jgi:ankyrin repeat protein